MTIRLEPPIQSFLVSTPSLRRRDLDAMLAANARAERRLAIARLAASTPGTLGAKQTVIRSVIAAGQLAGPVPCLATIHGLLRKYVIEGKRSAADYRDDLVPRGPTGAEVPQALVNEIRDLAEDHGVHDLAQLTYLAGGKAEKMGLRPLSMWKLRRVLAAIGAPALSAARHGSRAAELDAFPRVGTYPTRWLHDLWNLDEGDPRYWAKAFCPVREKWVSVRPPAILIRDHRSGLLIGRWLADPSRRIDDAAGRCMTTGFDRDDVLAALLSAAVKDFAIPELREFVGALPSRLRWDNARAHKALDADLFDVPGRFVRDTGSDEPDDEPVETTDGELSALPSDYIPVRRPDRNGPIERVMSMMKRWMVGHAGHVDEVIPVDRLEPGEDLGRDRSMVATSTTKRQPRLTPVPVRALPTIDDLRMALDQALVRYGTEHKLRRHGMTPRAAARRFMPPHYRRGDDLVRMLGAQTYTVGKGGIEVQRDGRSVEFEPVANGVLLQRGATLKAYVDPLLRCVWLEQGRQLLMLKPKCERAAEQAPADVAQTMSSVARAASDAAAERRAARLDTAAGPGTAAEGDEAYKAAQRQRRSPDQNSADAARADAGPQTRRASAEHTDGGFQFDPDALLSQDADEG